MAALVLGAGLSQSLWAGNFTQAQLDTFAKDAKLQFGVVSNFLPGGSKFDATLTITNSSSAAVPAGKGDWAIYIHSVRPLDAAVLKGLRVEHVQGDIHRLVPTADFAGLAAGASLKLTYTGSPWIVSNTDFMPRAFIAQQGLQTQVFASTDTENLSQFVAPFVTREQQLRFPEDKFAITTPASRFTSNQAVNAEKPSDSLGIVPTPKSVKYRRSEATLDASWQIRFAGRLAAESNYLQAQLKAAGLELKAEPDNVTSQSKTLSLSVNEASGEPESYQLTIGKDAISIIGADNAGAFYGIQSLLSLLPADTASSYSLPQLEAKDAPRFHWRGMHYDMARNFHGKVYTLRLIDQMAHYKLNKLHMHLTDDEGWRIEIPGLPELTQVGAQRCFDLSEQSCLLTQLGTGPFTSGSGNGFYSSEDFVEILKYAAARHIEVIPEIDMPGHGRAAIKSMEARYAKLMKQGKKAEAEQFLLSDPQDQSKYFTVQSYTDDAVNVCLDSTYAFADKVIYELQQMYRKAGLKLSVYHMGGDEVGAGAWTASPACNALFAKGIEGVAGVADLKPYFVSRLADITSKRGLSLAGWEDGLMYDPNNTFNRKAFANERVLANAWDNIWEWGVADRAYRLANAGYQVILSAGTHLYFDHPYEANPNERGYYWAARYTDTAKVFGFMPDNYYANAETTRAGDKIDNLEALVGRPLPKLEKPENVLGMQGQVWSETIRTGEQLEQMIYPRVMALGERAWHKASWESDTPNLDARRADWAQFAKLLVKRELPKLAKAGASFHLPAPGAEVVNGELKVNSALPGLLIEMSADAGKTWQLVGTNSNSNANAKVEAGTHLLLRSRLGEHTSRRVVVNP